MQTCKSDVVMLNQTYAKKLVYTVMQGWEIKQTNKKKQQEKTKNNAPPNWHIRWTKCKVQKDILVNSWGYSNAQQLHQRDTSASQQ